MKDLDDVEETEEYEDELELDDYEFQGKMFLVSGKINGDIYNYIDEDDEYEDIGEAIGIIRDGEPTFF